MANNPQNGFVPLSGNNTRKNRNLHTSIGNYQNQAAHGSRIAQLDANHSSLVLNQSSNDMNINQRPSMNAIHEMQNNYLSQSGSRFSKRIQQNNFIEALDTQQ